MMRSYRTLFCCCALAIVPALTGWAQPGSSPKIVLVLRNGRVLTGAATLVGSSYEVALDGQGEVRVPAIDVEMCCASLDEAYFRKREQLPTGDLPARFGLAEWCLRCGLPARAADQLLAIYAIAPEHPQLVTAERRLLSAAVEQPAQSESVPEMNNPAESADTGPALQLPDGAVSYFTQKIQPMLLNRCASNACHGQRSPQKFQLVRPVRGQPMSHRMTQRNLLEALAFVNQQCPEESQLLVSPGTPHGKLPTPVFSERDAAQYQQLVAWAKLVAGKGVLRETAPSTAPVLEAGMPPIAAPNPVAQASFVTSDPPPAANQPAPPPGPQRLPTAPDNPTDPLDPEAFNREFVDKQ